MQNRLVLTGIPSSIPRLPNAADALRDLVEEHGCWVDRFTFLPHEEEEEDTTKVVAAAELHIENVRNRAVTALDRLNVVLNSTGEIISSSIGSSGYNHGECCSDDERAKDTDTKQSLSFQIRAFPANSAQSKQLVERCPFLDSGLEDAASDKKVEVQTLKLPCGIELSVRRSNESGGTGTDPWRGGVILSTQICLWLSEEEIDLDVGKALGIIDFKSLFEKKRVLELGAGSAGLPSMTLSKLNTCDIDLITTDGVDEIVTALQRNISENKLGSIKVKHLDWNDPTTFSDDNEPIKADTILFADCVYNEEGATALCNAIYILLKVGGYVIGVLPDFRVGVDLFEKVMEVNQFLPFMIPMTEKQLQTSCIKNFNCSGCGGKNYRLLIWKDCRSFF